MRAFQALERFDLRVHFVGNFGLDSQFRHQPLPLAFGREMRGSQIEIGEELSLVVFDAIPWRIAEDEPETWSIGCVVCKDVGKACLEADDAVGEST
ncbi:MAG: hypothetical protein QM784_25985 [Polyangiaceae bacterium]